MLPNVVVPYKVRLEVYKKAVEIIENQKDVYKLKKDFSLCVLLPCILWNLNSCSDYAPNGDYWWTNHTRVMFPELEDFLYKGHFGIYTDEKRITFLRESIETLSKGFKSHSNQSKLK